MLHKEIVGLTLLFFILWSILAGDPSARINRACRPISWMGNVTTSVTALAAPSAQVTVQKFFDKLTYGCEYSIWRLFYQADYLKAMEEVAAEKARTSEAPASAVNKPEKKP